MQSSRQEQEALASLFLNLSTSSFLLLLLLYSAVSLLHRLLHSVGGYPLLHRGEDECDSMWFSDEEEEEEEEEEPISSSSANYNVTSRERNHLIADILDGGESLVFYNSNVEPNKHAEEFVFSQSETRHVDEDQDSDSSSAEAQFSAKDSPYLSESKDDDGEEDDDDDGFDDDDDDDGEIRLPSYDVDDDDSVHKSNGPTRQERLQSGLLFHDKSYNDDFRYKEDLRKIGEMKEDYPKDEKFIVFGHSSEIQCEEFLARGAEEEIFGDSCTNGSTSKSSSEWRSSVKTDDPFSSSSRRSCPKWESYAVFQKYDEEMTFLARISTQKLQETESLKSFMVEPRSISERIVHKISNVKKRPTTSSSTNHNPYVELESAYVAQICLTWEALSWNYTNFEHKRTRSRPDRDFDVGCPAGIADQFRRFHILLQRYIENEPYEHGRRPEILARLRKLAPKLLLVPEYQEYCEEEEEEEKEEGLKMRITSASFMMIMEECIRTFMNFLRADKENPCHKILKSFFGRNKRCPVDPTLLHLMKKVNSKKKAKLKEMRRGGRCVRKRRMRIEEEMEILMGLIDLKVVSRVLRMSVITEERLHWCEEKMSRVRIIHGKLLRDSSPLFFPPH
ncbi:PREDICTED: uncharacterized protein LOC104813903 [Tarenaya hassleriana]|uniref:uncharacterized protein LOC104813903 n=1 Tax=Tarenaya hassleriana TaxID=28532 RepID=UPI00053C4608|nr:PREDICTED: uncharacterized protein LOC104813903 [Tarenaya hassleriana]